jgi:penicillin-binding protein 2
MAMAYATVANGGISYYPRLVDRVLNQDGSPTLNHDGKIAVPQTPRVHADLRNDFTPEQIELVRRGLWKVVNEDGGTGRVARLNGVQVAGKTGTAEVTVNGKPENVAWFCSFAPYDHPKYVIAVMVQGATGHGGPVAGPIGNRIMERALAMDEGKFEPELAWLEPAHKQNPFQMIAAVNYKDAGPNVDSEDEESATPSQNANAQMAPAGADPDVEPAPDAAGKVQTKVTRPVTVATPPPRKPNFFERLFGARPKPAPAPPTPPPKQQPQQRPVRR